MRHPSGGSAMARHVHRLLLALLIVAVGAPALAQTPKRGGPRGGALPAGAFRGKAGLPAALGAGGRDGGDGPPHRAHHAEGAVRAVPEPPRQSIVLRNPAA